ncbi:MAG: hypothetical protein LBC30_00645 [Puniceicoccales bacterium]|jgi:hypothetical protein|nr:hypothetical protein [Puniceicoccales bacterium]
MGTAAEMGMNSEKELLEAFSRHKQRCSYDFPYFCAKELVIDRKGGGAPAPFVFNRAQEYVWEQLKKQWEKEGMIRANILKGRQQGMSTLVAALIFWKAVTTPCTNGTLVSKDYKATKSLFDKIKRFTYDRPLDKSIVAETCNLDEIRFRGTQSLIRMNTARSDQSQRGSTNQALFFVGSALLGERSGPGIRTFRLRGKGGWYHNNFGKHGKGQGPTVLRELPDGSEG